MKNTTQPTERGTVRGVFSKNSNGWYSRPRSARRAGVVAVTFWSATGYWTERRLLPANDPIALALSK